jgi:threonine dehydrogenase-like Zn-dependent dehydrogenase
MSSTVRAAAMKAPGRLEVERFPLPEPAPGVVLMKVTYSRICGTDRMDPTMKS